MPWKHVSRGSEHDVWTLVSATCSQPRSEVHRRYWTSPSHSFRQMMSVHVFYTISRSRQIRMKCTISKQHQKDGSSLGNHIFPRPDTMDRSTCRYGPLPVICRPVYNIRYYHRPFKNYIPSFEPAHEIMALFVLLKLIFQMRMRSHPV